jgi:23S rRNA (pseudouridine1915-N3)-methyltransferase
VIKIIAIGTKMPSWIDNGILHYAKQMKNLQIITIKNSNKKTECEKLLAKSSGFIIAMDEKGQSFDSMNFAKKLANWQSLTNKNISFLIGGADGLTDEIRQKADILISLSKMTMPHSMARLVLVEQIYRANSILNNHPYHREG